MNRKVLAGLAGAAALALIPLGAQAQVGGNLAATPAVNIELNLTGAGAALSAPSFELVTGDYYRLTINSDGNAEALWTSPIFMQNIWINQIVIAGVEVKLWGGATAVAGIELGEQGVSAAAITFVPIRPGEYEFVVETDAGEQVGTFIVR
jgi:hypothetical protein